jgi:hypothetical protein
MCGRLNKILSNPRGNIALAISVRNYIYVLFMFTLLRYCYSRKIQCFVPLKFEINFGNSNYLNGLRIVIFKVFFKFITFCSIEVNTDKQVVETLRLLT